MVSEEDKSSGAASYQEDIARDIRINTRQLQTFYLRKYAQDPEHPSPVASNGVMGSAATGDSIGSQCVRAVSGGNVGPYSGKPFW